MNTEQTTVKVGVSIFPPLVMNQAQGFTGFEIDLWEIIAKDLNISFSYTNIPFQELIVAVRDKRVAVAMAGLTLTEEREGVIDFSHSTFDSGMLILVPNRTRISPFRALRTVFTKQLRNIMLLLVGFVLLSAHLIWLAEKNSGGSLSGPYLPGIWNSIWWALETFSTVGYGDYTPVTVLGRAVGMLSILSGLAIFGLYIGQISSTITLKGIRSDISSFDDLAGKTVATVADSVSETMLVKLNARVVPVSTIERGYEQLETGEVEAVVFDSPVLLHYAHNEGRGTVTIVGSLFGRQKYGYALNQGSALKESINRAILRVHDTGQYAKLYEKWFGEVY